MKGQITGQYYEYHTQPTFLSSIFNNKSVKDSLAVIAHAKLEVLAQKNMTFKGKDTEACFLVIPDEEEVYDKSYKVYKASFPNVKVEYTTYSEADRLQLIINEQVYQINCIDGGSCVHIKFLKHKYQKTRDGECLTLIVTDDIPLTTLHLTSSILLRKGSFFIFDVKNKR